MLLASLPGTVRKWKRGTPLAEAKLVYEGEKGDVAASGYFYHDRGLTYEWRQRALTFWTSEHLVRARARVRVRASDDGALTLTLTLTPTLTRCLRRLWSSTPSG